MNCTNACVNDRCGGVCAPGTAACLSPTQARTCNAVGQWNTATTCQFACVNGVCGGSCKPGQSECVGGTSQTRTCSNTGEWAQAANCPGATCRRATCNGGVCGQQIDVGAPCGNGQTCLMSGECSSPCGNMQLDPGEECDIGAFGWSDTNCNSRCKRTTYNACTTNTRNCSLGCTAAGVCGELCSTDSECPDPPANATAICYHARNCALGCSSSGDCPSGLNCVLDPMDGNRSGVCMQAGMCSCDAMFGCEDCLGPLIAD